MMNFSLCGLCGIGLQIAHLNRNREYSNCEKRHLEDVNFFHNEVKTKI